MTTRKQNRTAPTMTNLPAEQDNLVRLWLHRAMVNLNGISAAGGILGWEDAQVAAYLNITDCLTENLDPEPKKARATLVKQQAKLESPRCVKVLPPPIVANIDWIARILRLSDSAKTLLAFVVIVGNVRLLAKGLAMLGELSTTELYSTLATILGEPPADIQRELGHDAPLVRSGLVSIYRRDRRVLPSKIATLSAEFSERMMSGDGNCATLFDFLFFASAPSDLEGSDFDHVALQRDLAVALLYRMKVENRRGINILVHGAPGVGKSELVRAVAALAGYRLYEVASAARDGDPLTPEERLGSYRAAVSLLTEGKNLLLFDESEDIFGRGEKFLGERSFAQSRKAWVNRALEENSVPTFWLTNAIEGIDPAFVRRFALVIEMPKLPQGRLNQLVLELTDGLLSRDAALCLAKTPDLAPAVVAQAADVVRFACPALGAEKSAQAMRIVVDGTLVAQGHRGVRTLAANDSGAIYSPECISADADLVRIVNGIRQSRQGRLCLYGPPGTGKTAFGHWLANEIGAPLVSRRVSDIVSPYVGKTEQKLAQTFREAIDTGAVLMLDEVDSFLQDRKGARHSWEVTQVNEMLTQMEAFDGVFIASTNLMDGLDPASIRRFDLKIRFGYLNATQSWCLLQRYCQHLGLGAPQPGDRSAVEALCNLTPGDFAAVARRHRFSPVGSPAEFATALVGEARLKRDGRVQAIGFVANG